MEDAGTDNVIFADTNEVEEDAEEEAIDANDEVDGDDVATLLLSSSLTIIF